MKNATVCTFFPFKGQLQCVQKVKSIWKRSLRVRIPLCHLPADASYLFSVWLLMKTELCYLPRRWCIPPHSSFLFLESLCCWLADQSYKEAPSRNTKSVESDKLSSPPMWAGLNCAPSLWKHYKIKTVSL